MFLAAGLALLVVRAGRASGAELEETRAYVLSPGWNLRSFQGALDANLFAQLEAEHVAIWEVGEQGEPTRPLDGPTRLSIADELGPGKPYWLLSEKATTLVVGSGRESRALAGAPDSGTWHIRTVSSPTSGSDLGDVQIRAWDAGAQRYFRLAGTELLTETHGYWVHAGETSEGSSSRSREDAPQFIFVPNPPKDMQARSSGQRVTIQWRAPRLFSDGSPISRETTLFFGVYRNGTRVAVVRGETHHAEDVPVDDEAYEYFVTAYTENDPNGEHQSVPSNRARLVVGRAVPLHSGGFERPVAITDGMYSARLPKTALSQNGGLLVAHVAYIAQRDTGKREELRYIRSTQGARANTFSSPKILDVLPKDTHVSTLAMEARGNQVSIAWIETPTSHSSAEDRQTRIWVVTSSNAGVLFEDPVLIREGSTWKRGLDVGYDRLGNHHLVWGEANKIFHLHNFTNQPSNVFDVRVRTPATQAVKYKAYHAPHDGTACRCEGCWCEESYPLSEEPDPNRPNKKRGPFLYRTEEAYVREPALHIGHDTITIIARQTSMWDNKPVLHPSWSRMYTDPEYSDDIILRTEPIKLVVGWKKVWKAAYEEGDEQLYASLGTRYQYRYQGTWHNDVSLKVAQRPVFKGAWVTTKVAPQNDVPKTGQWQEGAWRNHRQQSWRISVVDQEFHDTYTDSPSHPQVTTLPGARLLAVYEKGPSTNPNIHGDNSLYVALSSDGGQSWTAADTKLKGYTPSLASTSTGEVGLAFFEPGRDKEPANIRVVRTWPQEDWDPDALNLTPVRAVHHATHGQGAERLRGVPSIAAHEELFMVAWVRKAVEAYDSDQIVVARASRMDHAAQVPVLSQGITTDNRPITYVADNPDGQPKRKFTGNSGAKAFNEEPSTDDAYAPPGERGPSYPGEFHAAAVSSTAQTPFLALNRTDLARANPLSPADVNKDGGDHRSSAGLIPGNATRNYDEAQRVRDLLLMSVADAGPEQSLSYQVEYLPTDPLEWRPEDDQDSKHLAGFKRVWAYTQGIALAQRARQTGLDGQRQAQGMARYLCQQAVSLDAHKSLGWHFSWNTHKDHWKDARLVTGATAWAVHGLGLFITSHAFRALPSDQHKQEMKDCYARALRGLGDHTRTLHLQDGREVILMTAGWTTSGLLHADAPWKIIRQDGQPVTQDHSERWAYYSVLDAIGYDTFTEPPKIKVCTEASGIPCSGTSLTSGAWKEKEIDEGTWAALKERIQAENVVTEHNIDVLSVLNHAIKNAQALGLEGKEDLRTWRDRLRDGIFYALWDEDGWKTEFENAIPDIDASLGRLKNGFTSKARERILETKSAMEKALQENSLGRVITGGTLMEDASKKLRFQPSPHTAIDNCSWLALAVDYDSLRPVAQDRSLSVYGKRLDQCLQYTVLRFVKDLPFGVPACRDQNATCPPEPTYRGTHYFQNAFKDPYIEPSELQESSYHLEATTGLVAGLFRFADARPEANRAPFFQDEALALWAGVQQFVRDHGFPYSSQRIQDLSTMLASSTAAIWFIDVHDAIQKREQDFDRPLLPYADDSGLQARIEKAHATLEAMPLLFGLNEGQPTIEEQALAAMVFVSREDFAHALERILSLQDEDAPLPVDDTGTQMLIHYATVLLFQADPSIHDTPQGVQLLEALQSGLQNLIATRRVDGSGRLGGLFRAGESAMDTAVPVGLVKTEDNVLAYFTLDAAGALAAELSESGIVFDAHADALNDRLQDLCWLWGEGHPVDGEGVNEGYSGQASSRTLALCALFFAHDGQWDRAHSLANEMDLVLTSTEEALEQAPTGLAPDRRLWIDIAGPVLVRRALGVTDPRQEELALFRMQPEGLPFSASEFQGDTETTAPSGYDPSLGLLLAYQPEGAFGVFDGPLFGASAAILSRRGADDGQNAGEILKEALWRKLGDAMRALLVSTFRTHRFDALFHRVVLLRFAFEQVRDEVPIHRWNHAFALDRSEWIQKTDWELFNLCRAPLARPTDGASLPSEWGFRCERAQSLYKSLRRTRAGLDQPLEATLGDEPSGLMRSLFNDLNEALSYGPAEVWAISTAGEVCLTCGLLAPVVDWGAQASTAEMQKVLQHAITQPIIHALSPSKADGLERARAGKLLLRAPSVDVAAAFHPNSPAYWFRDSVLLRAIADHEPVPIELKGRSGRGLVLKRDPYAEENIRALRQLLNIHFDGRLPRAAEAAGLHLFTLHHAMRTGFIAHQTLESLLRALPLSDRQREALRRGFEPHSGKSILHEPGYRTDLIEAAEHATALVATGGTLDVWAERIQPYLDADGQTVDRVLASSMLRMPRISAPSKTPGQSTVGTKIRPDKGLIKALESLLRLEPASAGLGSALAVTLGLFVIEPTQMLSTIVVVDQLPEDWHGMWSPVGWVAADEVFLERFLPKTPWAEWTGFRSEEHIREFVPIYSAPSVDASSHAFDTDRIYLFEKEIFSVSDIPGSTDPGLLDIVLPQLPSALDDQPMIPVYALETDADRNAVIDSFLAEHPLWQWYLQVSGIHPALGTTEWNLWMRNFVLGTYFNADAATQAGGRKKTPEKPKGSGEIAKKKETPPSRVSSFYPSRGYDPGPALAALSQEQGMIIVKSVAAISELAGVLAGPNPFADIRDTLINLEAAGLIALSTNTGTVDEHTVVRLVPESFVALTDYLDALYPGVYVDRVMANSQLRLLADADARSIVEFVAEKTTSMSALKAAFPRLGAPVETYVEALLAGDLLFETTSGDFEIGSERGLDLKNHLKPLASRLYIQLPEMHEAIASMRDPSSLALMGLLSTFGTRTAPEVNAIFSATFTEAALVASELVIARRNPPYGIASYSLNAPQLLVVAAYLDGLFPGTGVSKLTVREELSLLGYESLGILDQLHAGAQSLDDLQARLPYGAARIETLILALEEAELVVRAPNSGHWSINPKPQLALANHLKGLVENARSSTLHVGQEFTQSPKETLLVLTLLSRHGPLPRTRLHAYTGVPKTLLDRVTKENWFERKDRTLRATGLVELHSANIQKSIAYFRHLFPGEASGNLSADEVLNVFHPAAFRLVLERLRDKPSTIDQLKADLPSISGRLEEIVEILREQRFVEGLPGGMFRLNETAGASLPKFLEDILIDASPKQPIRDVPEQALEALGREGAYTLMRLLHRLGPSGGTSLQEAAELSPGATLTALKVLRTAGLISADRKTVTSLNSQFSLVPGALEPIIAYLEAIYPGETVGPQSPELQAKQFGATAKIMVIERLRNGSASKVDLMADFPSWEDRMPDLLHELQDAGLIEVDRDSRAFRVNADRGLAFTEGLKLIARTEPAKSPDSTELPKASKLSGEYRAEEYTKKEMRKFVEDHGASSAIQIQTKDGYRIIKLQGAVVLKGLEGKYKFIRYLTVQQKYSYKSAAAIVKYVPETQASFRVTDLDMKTRIFNHDLEVVGNEDD